MINIRKCSTRGALEAVPEKNVQLNLNKLKEKYEVIADLPILILIKYENYEVTCYKNGKLLIRKCSDFDEALKIAEKIYEEGKI